MSQSDKGQEPSMEEILASIRRIISDDKDEEAPEEAPAEETAEAVSPAPAAAAPATQAETPAATPEAAPEATPADAPTDVPATDDSLVLTDIAEEAPPAQAPPPPSSEDLAEAGRDAFLQEAAAPAAGKPVEKTVPALRSDDLDAKVYKAMQEDVGRSLLSPPIKEKSTSTFAELAGAIHARGFNLGNMDMTLEDLIRDLLRPHLKEWLDQNLPSIVERLVRAEIERMSREAEERKDLL